LALAGGKLYGQLCCVGAGSGGEVPYIAVGPAAGATAAAAAAGSIRQPLRDLRDQQRQEVIGTMSNETEASAD